MCNRKDQIQDAAEMLFLTQGYEGTSVNQIVKRVGIAQGTFYYHFPSKEAVLDALVERSITPFRHQAEILAASDADILHRLVGVMSSVLRIRSERGPLMVYIHEDSNLRLHETFVRRVKELFQPVLVDVLDRGITSDDFHVHHPPETASFLLATVEYLFDSPYWESDPDSYMAQLKVTASVVEGLLGLPHDTVDISLLGGDLKYGVL